MKVVRKARRPVVASTSSSTSKCRGNGRRQGTPARPWADSGSDCRSRAMGSHDLGEPVIRSGRRREVADRSGGVRHAHHGRPADQRPAGGVRSDHGLADRDHPAGRSRAGAGRCGPVAGPPSRRRRTRFGQLSGHRPQVRRRAPVRGRLRPAGVRCAPVGEGHHGVLAVAAGSRHLRMVVGASPAGSSRRAFRSPSAARPYAGSCSARTASSSASRSTAKPCADDSLRPRSRTSGSVRPADRLLRRN